MEQKGWHSRGYLPHFDAVSVVQAVTFRLGDSLERMGYAAEPPRSLTAATGAVR